MTTVILPYTNLGETIGVNLDFGEVPTTKTGDHSFLVDRSKIDSAFKVVIEAQLPSKIDQAFPNHERSRPPMEVVATLISIDGSTRQKISLQQKKSRLFTGVATLDPSAVLESAQIAVYVVRGARGSAKGFAKNKGARVAWSPALDIRMSELPPSKGKFLQILWDDFSESNIVPRNFSDALHYIDIAGDPPILYLNKASKGALVTLLDTKGFGHPKANPRDTLLHSIAANAWLALVQSALEDLKNEAMERGPPVDLDSAFSQSWKRDVIEHIAPRLLPQLEPEEALLELCTKMDEEQYYQETLAKAQLAVQTDLEIRHWYEKFAEGVFANG